MVILRNYVIKEHFPFFVNANYFSENIDRVEALNRISEWKKNKSEKWEKHIVTVFKIAANLINDLYKYIIKNRFDYKSLK